MSSPVPTNAQAKVVSLTVTVSLVEVNASQTFNLDLTMIPMTLTTRALPLYNQAPFVLALEHTSQDGREQSRPSGKVVPEGNYISASCIMFRQVVITFWHIVITPSVYLL